MGRYFIQERQHFLDSEVQSKAQLLANALQRELESQIKLLTIIAESPRLDPPISVPAFSEIVRRLRDRVPEWEQVRVTNAEGVIVISMPSGDDKGQQVTDTASHNHVVKTGHPTVGNVMLGPKGRAAFAVRVPIERKDKLRAVLSVVIRPAILTNLLHANGLPSTWSAWVVDGQDRLVASTGNPNLAGGEAAMFANFNGSDFGRGEMKDGSELRVAQASLKDVPWRVRVGLPLAEYQALSRKASLLFIGASCLTLLLAASAVYLFLREVRARNRELESIANWQRMDALGKLTGQAAHEFNNLLMVFQSGVEGIKRRRDDEQRVSKMLAHMTDGIARGKAVTQRLLSFSRRSNQGAERIDLDLKLPEIVPLLRQAANDSLVVTLEIPADIWSVHADPAGLEIALINLVTNAKDAMPNGGEIRISARNVKEAGLEEPGLSGEVVALAVADTGKGIAQDDLRRVFEPFFTGKDGRSGLGLTQVHSFAKGSGGSVRVASLVGRGSAFTLFLPRSKEERQQQIQDRSAQQFPRSILIVDDTPESLESVRMLLEPHISNILVASSGDEALNRLQHSPDVEMVLSDIMMPGMSGIDLASRLDDMKPKLPVVLMTGYSDKMEQGADLGRPVVAKPFTIEALIDGFVQARQAADLNNVVPFNGAAKAP
ncbi:hybrid sensor histidine kinase/response regulator [Rhizobium deserti]|uniref:histidine kinase n=1 Tax=Rhizobium deserti TaxID=2547961 RepID=A0A4V3APZ5_9HYPH|nr:ATP-binding protein [Rhizobium deserti]TDK39720.1 hybrid sensor histidine kinase/response regulator [Rhizobium deserti]